MSFKKVTILGGSRGLGLELSRQLLASGSDIQLVARKPPVDLRAQGMSYIPADLARQDDLQGLLAEVIEFSPQQIIYCAGGGPYGAFPETNWKSHQWALQVSFLTPSWILHELWALGFLKQFVFLGSSVAEAKADPMASSYCAAKHGLKGLHATLEKEDGGIDVRLYSPGYMDTDMLPKGSWPRLQEKQLWQPSWVAQDILSWSADVGQKNAHKVLPVWADDT